MYRARISAPDQGGGKIPEKLHCQTPVSIVRTKPLIKFMLKKLRLRGPDPAALALYAAAIVEGRREQYYRAWGVPDTVEGRFDMISLTVALMNRRLGQVNEAQALQAQELGQNLFDVMFADMDVNLRELGVSDAGMKRRIEPMVSAHLGRIKAYTESLEIADEEACLQSLKAALARNVYRAVEQAEPLPLALRMIALARQLTAASDAAVLSGHFAFSSPHRHETNEYDGRKPCQ